VPQHVINLVIGHTTAAVGDAYYDATTLEEAARAAAEIMRRPERSPPVL
jgi:hypothetical protein